MVKGKDYTRRYGWDKNRYGWDKSLWVSEVKAKVRKNSIYSSIHVAKVKDLSCAILAAEDFF